MNGELEEESEFEINGITEDALDVDKRIFRLISEGIHNYMEGKGHSYTPQAQEFRVSSIAKCNRKILLDKDIKSYLRRRDRKFEYSKF